ncbi:hypothetical protein DEU48_101584 [Bacillus sp. AG442]|nr:hypothetical protein DEU48_101584 [Bacillus sp. AG442]TWK63165.1 hypothetical protein CHCC20342_3037 [Bacillus licheniformis]
MEYLQFFVPFISFFIFIYCLGFFKGIEHAEKRKKKESNSDNF